MSSTNFKRQPVFYSLLFSVAFVVLKLTGVIPISWWWITPFLLLPYVLIIVLFTYNTLKSIWFYCLVKRYLGIFTIPVACIFYAILYAATLVPRSWWWLGVVTLFVRFVFYLLTIRVMRRMQKYFPMEKGETAEEWKDRVGFK
jgi:hypothetical protein